VSCNIRFQFPKDSPKREQKIRLMEHIKLRNLWRLEIKAKIHG
jgi:hypothetical protein